MMRHANFARAPYRALHLGLTLASSLALSLPALAQEGGEGGEAPAEGGAGGDFNFSGDETPPPSEDTAPVEAPASDAEVPTADVGEPPAEKSQLDEGINLTLQDRIKAVSRKTFLKEGRFELQPAVMVTANDPFYRSWFLAGRAAYHINDAFAIELGGGYVPPFFVEQLPPVDVLREQALLINADAKLIGFLDAGVTFSPIYGKVAVLSDQIIHFDAFLIAGAGAVFDTNETFFHPAMNVGAGARVFILRWLVARVDVRDYVYPQDRTGISTLQNLLLVSAGVGFYFPFDFDYKFEAAKVIK
jgi:outer membrane beta-barrel protein